MLLIDSNSTLVHLELNEQIDELNKETEYFKKASSNSKIELSKIQSDSGLEKICKRKVFNEKRK